VADVPMHFGTLDSGNTYHSVLFPALICPQFHVSLTLCLERGLHSRERTSNRYFRLLRSLYFCMLARLRRGSISR